MTCFVNGKINKKELFVEGETYTDAQLTLLINSTRRCLEAFVFQSSFFMKTAFTIP